MPEGWVGGEGGAAAVEGNYGFLLFPAGFRDVYARVEYKCRRSAGSSLGRKREMVVEGGRNTTGIYPLRLRGWFGVNFSFIS